MMKKSSLNRKKENYSNFLDNKIDGLRIGIPKEFFEDGLNSDVQKVIEEALKQYEKLGAKDCRDFITE